MKIYRKTLKIYRKSMKRNRYFWWRPEQNPPHGPRHWTIKMYNTHRKTRLSNFSYLLHRKWKPTLCEPAHKRSTTLSRGLVVGLWKWTTLTGKLNFSVFGQFFLKFENPLCASLHTNGATTTKGPPWRLTVLLRENDQPCKKVILLLR